MKIDIDIDPVDWEALEPSDISVILDQVASTLRSIMERGDVYLHNKEKRLLRCSRGYSVGWLHTNLETV